MTNLIPMAGEGKRFTDAGYSMPKPLIPVSGRPMIVQAITSMPPSNSWVFVCRKDHIEKYGINIILKKQQPGCEIISLDKTTEGQACTCLLAKDKIDLDKPLFIGACDNGMVIDQRKWDNLASRKDIDAIILTFTRQPNLTKNPKSWGWVVTDSEGFVERVSVKVPVSSDPFYDHAIVGSFWFRTGRLFIDAAEQMIKKNIRTNNEFYVDSVPMQIIADKGNVALFDLDQYIGWGTPTDLEEYEHWEGVFRNGTEKPQDRKSELYDFWRKYFKYKE